MTASFIHTHSNLVPIRHNATQCDTMRHNATQCSTWCHTPTHHSTLQHTDNTLTSFARHADERNVGCVRHLWMCVSRTWDVYHMAMCIVSIVRSSRSYHRLSHVDKRSHVDKSPSKDRLTIVSRCVSCRWYHRIDRTIVSLLGLDHMWP